MSIHDIPDEDLRRGVTGCTILCQMDFATNPKNWWLGYGELTAGGVSYEGTGDAIKISRLQQSYGMSTGMARFTVPNASPEMIALCDDQESEVAYRRCQVFGQLFGESESSFTLVGEPFSIFVGRMSDMSTMSSAGERVIELEAYGILSKQGKPAYGRWTPADQRARYPGDKGLDLLPSLRDKAVVWSPK